MNVYPATDQVLISRPPGSPKSRGVNTITRSTTGGSSRHGARLGGGARRSQAEQDADGSSGPEAYRPPSPPEYLGHVF